MNIKFQKKDWIEIRKPAVNIVFVKIESRNRSEFSRRLTLLILMLSIPTPIGFGVLRFARIPSWGPLDMSSIYIATTTVRSTKITGYRER